MFKCLSPTTHMHAPLPWVLPLPPQALALQQLQVFLDSVVCSLLTCMPLLAKAAKLPPLSRPLR